MLSRAFSRPSVPDRTGVDVCVAYPPDTDTPGFEVENQTKPPETFEISGSGSLCTAPQVARAMLRGIRSGGSASLLSPFHQPPLCRGVSWVDRGRGSPARQSRRPSSWLQAGITCPPRTSVSPSSFLP